jgi:hypothetical protein
MKCSGLTLYRNPCKNKDVGENGLCKRHNTMELTAKPKKEGKCIFIRRNNERCFQYAYSDGENKDYCAEHSLYVLYNKNNKNSCKCCLTLYMNTQQENLGGSIIEISDEE